MAFTCFLQCLADSLGLAGRSSRRAERYQLLVRTVRLKLKFDDVLRELQLRTEAEYQGISTKIRVMLKELEQSLFEESNSVNSLCTQ